MQKLSLFFTLSALIIMGTGCLKDEGFENQEYGVKITEVKGVAFPESSKSPVMVGITSQTTPTVINGPIITLEQDGVATSDVQVTLTLNNALVTDAGLTPLPAGSFTVNSLTVTIPAGKKSSEAVKITIPNSTVLNAALSYGVGFSISSVDQGYKIASNQKNVVMGFTIKNKYDGVYKLKIKTVGWGAYGIADGVTGTYPGEIELITVAENSVSLFSTYRGDDLQPAFTGGVGVLGGPTAFGATTPLFVFNTTTNQLTDVRNTTPDDGRGRVLLLNPAVTTSRFDPATKTIYAAYIMKQNGRPDQPIYDTLSFIRAR